MEQANQITHMQIRLQLRKTRENKDNVLHELWEGFCIGLVGQMQSQCGPNLVHGPEFDTYALVATLNSSFLVQFGLIPRRRVTTRRHNNVPILKVQF